ncbi:MAG: hypothetical protein HYX69_14645 [Planctomycetia bacterium]|nr:hypothetical protein [Planctomycetia bacterium]
MQNYSQLQPTVQTRPRRQTAAIAAWTAAALLVTVPIVLRTVAAQASGAKSGRSTALVLVSLAVAAAGALVLAAFWQPMVRRIGNSGLAVIALVAGLQFSVSYAARLVGFAIGAVLGPYYVFVDGIGSKGLSCLFLGLLVTLLPLPGVLALALVTLFVLNGVTTGQLGLVSVLFAAVTIAIQEFLAAVAGVTTGRGSPIAGAGTNWSFVSRVGLVIGAAHAMALFSQYAMYEILMRQFFDLWFKVSVSLVTGLLFGGVGAACGSVIGFRLRRTAP